MGVKESYELYTSNEERNADCIPFHDYCRWWCMINGVDQHQLIQQYGDDQHILEQWGCQTA